MDTVRGVRPRAGPQIPADTRNARNALNALNASTCPPRKEQVTGSAFAAHAF
jgi:hypothetical protein